MAASESERCANCDRTIGRLEEAHLHGERVVCAQCRDLLTGTRRKNTGVLVASMAICLAIGLATGFKIRPVTVVGSKQPAVMTPQLPSAPPMTAPPVLPMHPPEIGKEFRPFAEKLAEALSQAKTSVEYDGVHFYATRDCKLLSIDLVRTESIIHPILHVATIEWNEEIGFTGNSYKTKRKLDASYVKDGGNWALIKARTVTLDVQTIAGMLGLKLRAQGEIGEANDADFSESLRWRYLYATYGKTIIGAEDDRTEDSLIVKSSAIANSR